MSILAGLHLYPKTPKDLTVTTRLGGTVSLIGLIVMGFLFATELRAYVVPSLETTIELDDNAEKKLLIRKKHLWHIDVPKFVELSVKNLYTKLLALENMHKYFPSAYPKGRGYDRDYMFNVVNFLHPGVVDELVTYALK